MGDLVLKGTLNLQGTLKLIADGGKVKAGAQEVLVKDVEGKGTAPVLIPPPPLSPVDQGLKVVVVVSFNQTVTAGGKAIVAQGMCFQGDSGPIWPGMVQASTVNSGVKANNIPMNVVGDQATILPTGAPAMFSSASGQ